MSSNNSRTGPGHWSLMLVVGGILGIFLGAVFKQSVSDVTPGLAVVGCVILGVVFFSANWAGTAGRVVQFAVSCVAAMLVTALFLH